mmetsp:Transcript_13418/g.41298  ORF Transcript_13418/g.41298 Transcript_13418/m.41298 type:complete len:972 (+) Transcript_13418:276-3191(+)
MAKLKYRIRVLLGDQELVLLVPAAPETTVGELQTEVLARARRQGIIGSACAFSVDGALLDELDSVEDVLEVEQTIDARLSPPRECSWSAADLAALVGFSDLLRDTIVENHASLAAFRRSPDGYLLSASSRVTPAKRSAPDADENCVAAPAPADEDESDAGEPADEDSVAAPAPAPADADESDDEQYVWPAGAPRGDALVGSRIRIWWPHDRAWFSGSVNAFDGSRLYEITYTDGSLWDEDLAERRWELLDERGLAPHEQEFLRVERLRLAGKASHKSSVDGGIYRHFYELCGAVNPDKEQKKSLRERTRLIIDPFLGAPVADAADEESDGEESEERRLAPHEREFLRVERLIAAGEASRQQGGAAGSVYSRFYELCGVVNPSHQQKKTLRLRARDAVAQFLDAPVADPGGAADEESDDAPPPRKRAAPASAETSERTSRPRRGHGSAEVVSEKDFGGLWAQLTAKGWKVLTKPGYIAPGDPRTWMWCAPDIVEPQATSGVFQLRSRDAGKIGESIFLDKDDLWVWAVRKGLVAAAPRRRARVDSSDDESAPPPRRRARTEGTAPDYRDPDSSDNELAPRPVRTEAPDYRESKGTSGRLTFRYETPMCGKCRNCLDKPKFGGSGKGKQACVLRLRERAELLEAGSTHPPPVRRRRDPNEPCTICFSVVAEADAVYGSDVCSHVFHRECIEGWARECAERPHNVATRRGVRVPCPNCKKGQRVVASTMSDEDGGSDSDASDGDGCEGETTELMAEAPALVGGATRSGQFGVGAQVEVVDDATVRGVIVDCRQSWKEVATTSGSIVLIRSPQLARATLTDEEAARCTRPISRKDYVQARIDGVIRFSHGGNDFRNCYTCADGTERRQFEVSGNHVRCALCPEARWPLGIDCSELMRNFKRHCGQLSDGERRPAAPLHLERLVSAAAAPGTPPVASADEAKMVLGISLAQAVRLAEAAAAGRLIPIRGESSSAPD